MIYTGEWKAGFPSVMNFVDPENCCARPWKLLENHPCYNSAKTGDNLASALHMVYDLLNTPGNEKQLIALGKKYKGAVVVPVHAVEAGGENKIPEALAEYLSSRTRLDVDYNIVQTNRVHRTGSDLWHRFAFRPSFDGPVKSGCDYILVDDVFTHGGSFNELRLFIERNGGNVVQTAALSLGGHGNKIAPEPELMKSLIDKFSVEKLNLFLKEIDLYDGNCKTLTNPETFALGRAASLDEARDRILAAKQAGGSFMVSGSHQNAQNQTPDITSQFKRRF